MRRIKPLLAAALNTVTDPIVIFNFLCNVPLGFSKSPVAGAIGIGAGFLCAVARGVSELKKADISLSLPRPLRAVLENPGASNLLNGSLNAISTLFSGLAGTPGNLESYRPAAAFGCNTIAGLMRGGAFYAGQDSKIGRLLETGGILATTTALLLYAGSDAAMATYGIYAAATAASLMESFGKLSRRVPWPDLLFAAGGASAIASSADTTMMIVNAGAALGFLTFGALRAKGGVAEVFGFKF